MFKKRYDDLKRHYDSTVNKHKDEVSRFKTQLEESTDKIQLPKTKEEIDAWRTKYPDVYDVIETIAHTKADEKAKQVQTKLKDLEIAQADVTKEKAEVKLSQLHPDFNDIRADEKFHDWVAKQDSTIQGWLYDNTSNANLAARAIDLYKLDAGIGKKVVVDKKEASKAVTSTSKRDIDAKDKKVWTVSEITKLKPSQLYKVDTGHKKKKANSSLEASKSVTSTSKRDINTANKKTWKVSDIAKMKPAEFAKHEKDIDLARVEGRIVNA